MAITETRRDNLAALIYDNDRIRLTLLPELGAKVISLFDLSTGREWMARQDGIVFGHAQLDDAYADHDKSGWDECFPSIGAGFHPAPPWTGTRLADHGELWSRPWHWRAEADSIVSTIYGARFPYRFERRLTLEGNALHADYLVSNLVERPFPCLWAMHPLFAAEPGMQVLLPGVTRVTCELSTDVSTVGGYLERLDWPAARAADGTLMDLATLRPEDSHFAIKLFTEKLTGGHVALYQSTTGAWLGLKFDCSIIPYLGLWLNQGGWPDPRHGLYHVALEPAIAQADHLDVAMRLGDILIVPPHGSMTWRITVIVGHGRDALNAFLPWDG